MTQTERETKWVRRTERASRTTSVATCGLRSRRRPQRRFRTTARRSKN
ncbi:hypothetical protein ACQVQK_29905 [Bacillus cereus]|nr:hypothetical protein [Bacillus thuringiensis]